MKTKVSRSEKSKQEEYQPSCAQLDQADISYYDELMRNAILKSTMLQMTQCDLYAEVAHDQDPCVVRTNGKRAKTKSVGETDKIFYRELFP